MIFDRVVATTRNWLEVARHGGLETAKSRRRTTSSPRPHPQAAALLFPPVKAGRPRCCWCRHDADRRCVRRVAADQRRSDLIEQRHRPVGHRLRLAGTREAGLERNLADHVLAVDAAIDEMSSPPAATPRRLFAGRHVLLPDLGVPAQRRHRQRHHLRQPGDLSKPPRWASPRNRHSRHAGFVMENVLQGPVRAGLGDAAGFQLLDPVKAVTDQLQFLAALTTAMPAAPRRPALPDERRLVAWPGPAAAEFLQQFLVHNRMLTGGFSIAGRPVTLADITSPILAFVGDVDEIARPLGPESWARPARRTSTKVLHAGHFRVGGGQYRDIAHVAAGRRLDAVCRRQGPAAGTRHQRSTPRPPPPKRRRPDRPRASRH